LDVFFRICAFRVYICRILRAKREIVPWLLVIWVLNPKKEVMLIAQKKTLPDKDTKVYKLLEMIGIFGEFPTALLSRLNVGKGYEEKMVSSLKRHGLIRTHYEDGRRGLRLTTIGKRFLLAENPNRFEFYLSGYSDTNKVRCDPHRRDRLHRIAEASVTMSNAGVSIFRDERPAIFSPSWEGGEWIRAPAFYTSREIKESGSTFSKIKGARAIGVMLTPYNIFITYNLGSSLMKWRYRAEMRNKALIQNMLCLERMPKQYSPNCICAILLADSMEFAQKILENKIEQYMLLDDNYENFFFVTNDERGEMLLRLLCHPDLCTELDEILTGDLCYADPGALIENDAMTEDGRPVILAYKCNLNRIQKFDTSLKLQNKRGVIICFDYQAEVLRRYCSEAVEFQTLDYKKTERRFFS